MKTNDYILKLRSTSRCSALTVAMCLLIGQLTGLGANTIQFAFTGTVVSTNGAGMNDLPSSVAIGAFCHGHVVYVYNPTPDSNPDPNSGIYNLPPQELTISLTVGNDTFTSGTSYQKTINVVNNSQQPISDHVSYTASEYLINSSAPAGNLQSQNLNVALHTLNLNALLSDGLLATAPRVEDFPITGGGYREVTCYSYRSNAFYYGFTVAIDNISGPPQLAITRAGDLVEVRWSTNLLSYQLESSTNLGVNLANGAWIPQPGSPVVDGSEFKVNVAATNGMQFFRLRKGFPN